MITQISANRENRPPLQISEIRATKALMRVRSQPGVDTRGRLHAESRRLCMRMLHVDISAATCL